MKNLLRNLKQKFEMLHCTNWNKISLSTIFTRTEMDINFKKNYNNKNDKSMYQNY